MATKYVSPKGTAGYPKLTRPDTKFKAEGEYSTSLTMDAKTAQPFMETIKEAFVEEFGAKAEPKANYPFKKNDDGTFTFKFKSKNKPKLFDSHGKPIRSDDELNIGSGSTLKVAGAISCRQVSGKYYATLYINQVQVINLVEFSSSPFGEEEGDFTASEDSAPAESSATDEEVEF